MYKELNAELARIGWDKKQLAEKIGMSYSTLITKLRGEAPLKLDEAISIKRVIGSTMPLESLFLHK